MTKWLRTSVLPSLGDVPDVHQEEQVHEPCRPEVRGAVGRNRGALAVPEGVDARLVGRVGRVGQRRTPPPRRRASARTGPRAPTPTLATSWSPVRKPSRGEYSARRPSCARPSPNDPMTRRKNTRPRRTRPRIACPAPGTSQPATSATAVRPGATSAAARPARGEFRSSPTRPTPERPGPTPSRRPAGGS